MIRKADWPHGTTAVPTYIIPLQGSLSRYVSLDVVSPAYPTWSGFPISTLRRNLRGHQEHMFWKVTVAGIRPETKQYKAEVPAAICVRYLIFQQ